MKLQIPVFTKIFVILVLIVLISVGYLYRRPLKNIAKRMLPVVVLKEVPSESGTNIIFLHHSTGAVIWNGGVSQWFEEFRRKHNKNYYITEQWFPKSGGNYPYDYCNIWINNEGNNPYNNDPTLEMITKNYDVIIWKQCFPVSNIEEDRNVADINSDDKRIENYKLQYEALKNKMRGFSNIKFVVWTGAALVQNATTQERAERSKAFFDWVRNEWDESGDNIFLWDFYILETEGDLYLKNKYAVELADSHPNESFSRYAAPLFCQRIVNVIEGKGDVINITGE